MDIDTFAPRLASLERRMSAIDGTIQPQPGNPAARGAVAPGNPNPGGTGPVKADGAGGGDDGDQRFPTANEVRDFIKHHVDEAMKQIDETVLAATQLIEQATANMQRTLEDAEKKSAAAAKGKPEKD